MRRRQVIGEGGGRLRRLLPFEVSCFARQRRSISLAMAAGLMPLASHVRLNGRRKTLLAGKIHVKHVPKGNRVIHRQAAANGRKQLQKRVLTGHIGWVVV